MMNHDYKTILFSLILLLPAGALSNDYAEIDLSNIPVTECDVEWHEFTPIGELVLRITAVSPDVCDGGGCEFSTDEVGGIFQPARLEIRKATGWVELIWMDTTFLDDCGPECTRMMFCSADGEVLASVENESSGDSEWLELLVNDIPYQHPDGYVVLESCNARFDYIGLSQFWDYVVEPSISQVKEAYQDE